jgi:hypothetical protein
MTDDRVPLVFWLFLGAIMIGAGYFLHPSRAQCPPQWHNNGIRPSGAFDCTRTPVGDPDWDGTHGRPDRSVVPPGRIPGRIYCTGGMHPIVVDDRAVGCQR